ncbi:MAG: 1,4-dihydroxy-2-naphthoate octaprenyltransferase [Bacteroidales bacterium]|nr:1,4-dihydroxy-2-naphthoate octaprenyltransferase [Bacteroidales bacterium]
MPTQTFNRWIIAARPRTLPLAFTGPLLGSCIAYAEKNFSWSVALWSVFTTLLLQILSNFANDYGDFVKGTDVDRKGPTRALQSNLISVEEMKKAILLLSLITLLSGTILVFVVAENLNLLVRLLFFLVGLSAIYAAIKYTIGEKPYGYRGWGDVVVFLFFGLISTIGTFVLHTGNINWLILLPAMSMGLLSAAVLNINNIRDYYEDIRHNKKTIPVLLGLEKAKIYHLILVSLAIIFLIIPVFIRYYTIVQLAFLVTLPFFIKGMYRLYHFSDPGELNRELKNLALTTFWLAILWGFGQIL